MKKLSSLILYIIFIVYGVNAQNLRPIIEVTSAVDTSRITIGDRITYTISIDHVDTMQVENPGAGVNLGQFEIKDYKIFDPVSEDGRVLEKFEYVISVFDTGTYVIPAFPVAYFPLDSLHKYKIIEASPITIHVESVLDAEDRELRDVKPPIDIPYNYFLLISIVISVLLIGMIGYIAYRLYKKRKESGYLIKPPAPQRPAHEIALEALDELEARNLVGQGEIKPFYIAVSEIFRHYVEGRYFIRALEETSTEILTDLKRQDLDAAIFLNARNLLELCDLVKFAKYIPEAKENESTIPAARSFVQATALIFEPVTETGDDAVENPAKPQVSVPVSE